LVIFFSCFKLVLILSTRAKSPTAYITFIFNMVKTEIDSVNVYTKGNHSYPRLKYSIKWKENPEWG
jgi:hypothetical protein